MQNAWPEVTKDYFSVAQYSKDRCHHCKAPVGTAHGRECVCVTRQVEMHATITFKGKADARHVPKIVSLLWTHRYPHFWGKGLIEFHANEHVSYDLLEYWHEVKVLSAPDFPDIRATLEALADGTEYDPDCGDLRIDFLNVVDQSPTLRKEGE